jgi:hypothetical protein
LCTLKVLVGSILYWTVLAGLHGSVDWLLSQ